MSDRIIDTDVVSFFLKGDSRAKNYFELMRGRNSFISFATVAELYRWPLVKNWGEAKIRELEAHLGKFVMLPSSKRVCRRWAEVSSIPGRPVSYHDARIAATAIAYEMPLITNNVKHFRLIPNLQVITATSAT